MSAAGERIGAYRLVGLLGRGGMGEVWLAEREGERVALKIMRGTLAAGTSAVERFVREIEILASLDHPGIVGARGGVEQEGAAFFYAMEAVLGRNLAALLETGGPLEAGHAVALTRQILEALGVAHNADVVHRDVKPSNILIDRTGQARLTDFGLARATNRSRLTAADTILGTPAYMSPEQARGDVATAQSDLYSVGAVLFELLTGNPPFRAENPLAMLRQHMDEAPPDLAKDHGVAPLLSAAVARSLSKSPSERFESATAMADALLAACPGDAVREAETTHVLQKRLELAERQTADLTALLEGATRSTVESPRPPASPRRRGVPLAFAALGLLLVAGLAFVPGFDPRENTAPDDPVPLGVNSGAVPPSDTEGLPVVTIVLRRGDRVRAWLLGMDAETVDYVDASTRQRGSFARNLVEQIAHVDSSGKPW